MVQYIEKYKKNIALDMRKRGSPYSEIQNRLSIPKSTLSYWFRGVTLTELQRQKLDEKRRRVARENARKKILKTQEAIAKIQEHSLREIRKISEHELWLMGIMLCWREHYHAMSERRVHRGVHFTSADPHLIRFFLTWLYRIGKLKRSEIVFDIFLHEDKKNKVRNAIAYWASITDAQEENFSRTYFYKERKQKYSRTIQRKNPFGLLRIRVRASSLLARQISGWIQGIEEYFWGDY